MTISFHCPQCQSPCTAPPEMAGRKAKCLKCTQVIEVPNPERDRWPPGMEPPGVKSAAAAHPAAPQRATAAPPARPVAAKPSGAQPTANAPPRAKPVASPQAPAQPVTAQPSVSAQPVTAAQPVVAPQPPPAPAIPVAKAVPITPVASPAHIPVAKPVTPPVAETVSEDIDDLLNFERPATAIVPPKAPGDNPYQSPQAAAGGRAGGPTEKDVRFGEVLQTTWRIYKSNFGVCLAGSVLTAIGAGATMGLFNFALVQFAEVVKQNHWQSQALAIAVVATFFTVFFSTLIFFTLGMLDFLLLIAKGRETDFSRLVGSADLLLPGLGMLVLVVLSVLVGLVLLIVPGLFVGFLFLLAPIALIDRQEGVIESLSTSAKLVSKNLATIMMLFLTVGLGCGIVSGLTCGLGQIVTGPFQSLMMIVVYLRASGKRVAGD